MATNPGQPTQGNQPGATILESHIIDRIPTTLYNSHVNKTNYDNQQDQMNHECPPMNTYVEPAIPQHYNPYSPLQYNNTPITPTQTVNTYPQHTSCGYIGQNQTHNAVFTNSVQQSQTHLKHPHQSHHQH